MPLKKKNNFTGKIYLYDYTIYMKKILFSFLFLTVSCALLGAQWSVLRNYDEQEPDVPVGEKYLLHKILQGKEIKIALSIEQDSDKNRKKMERMIEKGYNDWFKVAAKEIRKQKRTEEFADIMPILDRGVPISFVARPYSAEDSLSDEKPSGDQDITIYSLATGDHIHQKCKVNAAACYDFVLRKMWLSLNEVIEGKELEGEVFSRFLVHEIGHSLGFSDRYYRTYNNDDNYGSEQTRNSIMNEALKITCDDAEGMINLIDLTNGYARGGKKGWKGLCSPSEWYINGKLFYQGDYHIFSTRDRSEWGFAEGTKVKEIFPLAQDGFLPSAKVKVIRRDEGGLPLVAQGEYGETIYYMHLYDEVVKLAILNQEVVYAQRDTVDDYAKARWVVFGVKGKPATLKGVSAQTIKNSLLQKDFFHAGDFLYKEEDYIHQQVFKTQIRFLNGKKEVKSWEEKEKTLLEDSQLDNRLHRAAMLSQVKKWCNDFAPTHLENGAVTCSLFVGF